MTIGLDSIKSLAILEMKIDLSEKFACVKFELGEGSLFEVNAI